MLQLKPTRMTVSDLRPSLSYRVGTNATSPSALQWVELALAADPALFAPDAVARRRPETFVTFCDRFKIHNGDSVIHIPPAALLQIAGARRIYAGAALFGRPEGGAAQAVIMPDAQSVYVAAEGFNGEGIRQRFGFSTRPDIAGDARPASAGAPPIWAGDRPAPDRAAPPASSAPLPQSGQSPRGTGASREGHVSMNQSQGFMHKNAAYHQPAPPPTTRHNGNGQVQAAPVDYDDGFPNPPPPLPPNGQTAQPGTQSNGNGQTNSVGPVHVPPNGVPPQPMPVMPGNGQPQPMPVMPGNAQPQPMPVMPGTGQGQPQPVPMPAVNGQAQPAQPAPQPQAAQQAWSRPLEYVLPEFESYWPMDVIRTLAGAWARYRTFTAGVSDTTNFPFSSIVCIRGLKRKKSDNSVWVGTGTAFYIGPNLLLTNAHNFAESSRFHPVHSATLYAGLNSTQGPGNAPVAGDAVSTETIDPSTSVTIHPLYYNSDASVSKAHDLAVVRVQNAAPHGQHFRIADFSPAPDRKIAVCGYGVGSHAQGNTEFDWQDLLPEALSDYKQHMDADVIREVVNNGEGIHYNLQTLAGNSGSPVFLAPEAVQGDDPTTLMQVIGVHSSGATNTRNHAVLLTPNKRDWALSGGTVAGQQSYYGQPMGYYGQQPAYHGQQPAYYGQEQAYYGQAMVAPPTWAPIAASLVGTAATAGIAGLQSSSGDLTWNLQKMEGWLPAGGHPTPNITVDRATIQTQRNIEINSPVYQGTFQGNMYAHFHLDFMYDGTGVGGISIEPAPHDSHDNATGGMRIDMQITPLLETFPSQRQTGVQVAGVEVKMMYTYEWTVEDNDQVTVIYRFYGDGTYESRVRGGSAALDRTDTTYQGHRR